MARRQHLTLTVALVVFGFLSLTYLFSSSASRYPKAELLSPIREAAHSNPKPVDPKQQVVQPADHKIDFGLSSSVLTGGAIAPKLENQTAKYVYSRRWRAVLGKPPSPFLASRS